MLERLPPPRVVFLLVAAASAWLCAAMPVFSQEAYYWTYAQHPALSYFDHPPMVAWLIWLGTHVFGDGSWGIRFGTWLCGLATTAVGAQLLKEFGIGRAGQSAWILLSFATPILTMTHFLANPDPMLVCCWAVVMFTLWKARNGGFGWWILTGVVTGIGLLSKYTAAFLGVSGVLLLLFDPQLRRQLLRPGPWVAVVVAAVVFLPVVAWNYGNDFESFRFQTEERYAHGTLGVRWLAEFVGGQALVAHPLLAVLIPISLLWFARRLRRDPRALWLLAFGVPLPAYLLFTSLWIQVKINWMAPAYVPLVLGLVVWWTERTALALRPRLAKAMVASLLLVPAALPFAPALRLVPPGRGSSWTGWDEIAVCAEKWEERLDDVDDHESNVFFFAADYRDAAQLGRALHLLWQQDGHHLGTEADPGEPTLAQNVLGQRALQFDHWSPPNARIGQDAVFVLPRPQRRGEMVDKARARFERVELAEHLQIECLGIALWTADIYTCHGYKGPDADS
ncbi:MAG: glycosyltransferase family 39 protein [Planctomycetes bacterium]|jgi:dolichol-phosphate mannosyltransferase|nr:glycosyltransferase family 39 protein [Planctomycetota bacterium]